MAWPGGTPGFMREQIASGTGPSTTTRVVQGNFLRYTRCPSGFLTLICTEDLVKSVFGATGIWDRYLGNGPGYFKYP
eukprot:2817239-Rhodomonas_salina.1